MLSMQHVVVSRNVILYRLGQLCCANVIFRRNEIVHGIQFFMWQVKGAAGGGRFEPMSSHEKIKLSRGWVFLSSIKINTVAITNNGKDTCVSYHR